MLSHIFSIHSNDLEYIFKSFRNNTIFNIQIGPLVIISSFAQSNLYEGKEWVLETLVPIQALLLPCYLIRGKTPSPTKPPCICNITDIISPI